MEISEETLWLLVRGLVRFPSPQVCRHLAALDIVSLMEEHGASIPDGLARALVAGSEGDVEADRILTGLICKCEEEKEESRS